MTQFAAIFPDERTKIEMRAIERVFRDMREDQVAYAMHCMRSWGLGHGAFADLFLRKLRLAAKKARQNRP